MSDVQLGADPRLGAAVLAATQSQWVGHTTYGYGDTEIVAYSERLATCSPATSPDIRPRADGAPTSLGAAVRDAKQRYLASTLVLTPYDEKILQSWTYYGLPMYTIGNRRPHRAPSAGITTETPVLG